MRPTASGVAETKHGCILLETMNFLVGAVTAISSSSCVFGVPRFFELFVGRHEMLTFRRNLVVALIAKLEQCSHTSGTAEAPDEAFR